MNLDEMSKDQLEAVQIQKENEYRLSMDSLITVELQDLELSKKYTEIQLERKNLAPAIAKGKHNLRRIVSELRNIKTFIYRRLSGE